jgi:hypothetical protein
MGLRFIGVPLFLGCLVVQKSASIYSCRFDLQNTGFLANVGGTGDSPVPVGDPPTGTERRVVTTVGGEMRFAIPSGDPPDGTGQWPVLPSFIWVHLYLSVRIT